MADMIAAKPNAQSPHAHLIYALWLEELGDIPAALEENKIVLKLKEDFPVVLFHAGTCELKMRQLVDAEQHARRGLASVPQDAEMYILMAEVYNVQDHRDKAIEVLKHKRVDRAIDRGQGAQLLWQLANLLLEGPGRHGQRRHRGGGERMFQATGRVPVRPKSTRLPQGPHTLCRGGLEVGPRCV